MWVGPVALLVYVLLVWWLHDGPFTTWGKRRAKRRERTTEQLREQYARSRAARLYLEGAESRAETRRRRVEPLPSQPGGQQSPATPP